MGVYMVGRAYTHHHPQYSVKSSSVGTKSHSLLKNNPPLPRNNCFCFCSCPPPPALPTALSPLPAPTVHPPSPPPSSAGGEQGYVLPKVPQGSLWPNSPGSLSPGHGTTRWRTAHALPHEGLCPLSTSGQPHSRFVLPAPSCPSRE